MNNLQGKFVVPLLQTQMQEDLNLSIHTFRNTDGEFPSPPPNHFNTPEMCSML